MVFLKYVAGTAIPKSYEFARIRDDKIGQEKERYSQEISLLKSQVPNIFEPLKEKIENTETANSIKNPYTKRS
jgi:hypothetical protein